MRLLSIGTVQALLLTAILALYGMKLFARRINSARHASQPFRTSTKSKLFAGDSDPPVSNGPSLFSAIQQQLGLRLVPAKVPVEYVVIDHIERPTPN